MKTFKWGLVALVLLTIATQLRAQVTIVKHNKPQSRILLLSNTETDRTAAQLLQDFTQRITGATLPIVTDNKVRKGDILISNHPQDKSIKEDGFRLKTEKDNLHIIGAAGKGTIYGVVTLLEKYLGVSYWGEKEYSLQQANDIQLPTIDLLDNPAFRYRQSQFYGMHTDPIYKLWNRLEEPKEVFADGLWVHTFDRLLPSAVYGETNPEFYSFFKGKRHPGKASQWCLTNPELFEVVATRIDSIFKANPTKKLISVSQNDGNYTNCTCEACKKIDDHEGSLSGSMIYFLNKLATRFPDKEFSTLAYLYTMHPPKHIKPLPNVNIMLCDIDCNREVSLTENASGQDFMKAMKGWAKISNNIFVWDYGINFDNMVAPFPNFHILQDNIKLFKEHHATMHFSQIAGSRGGDFAELRTYLVAKLMWNPEADVDSLMQTFLQGYYGAASSYLYQYIKTMEGALIGSGNRLWIYDSPVSHKTGMLKPELMRRYEALFDKAEAAVASEATLLSRVRRTRLPLQYAALEIIRTEQEKDLPTLNARLDEFESRVKAFNVATLNERNNSPVDYCHLYRERYLPQARNNMAAGAKIQFLVDPSGNYKKLGETALTDNLFGGSSFVESWVGWEGIDGSFIIDLGEEKSFTSIETDFLHQLGQWILLPTEVSYAISSDNETFKPLETYTLPEDRSPQVKFVQVKHQSKTKLSARYIKVSITGTKKCPHWHYGVGHPCWFFIDEVTVSN
jgi:hypothetical protein